MWGFFVFFWFFFASIYNETAPESGMLASAAKIVLLYFYETVISRSHIVCPAVITNENSKLRTHAYPTNFTHFSVILYKQSPNAYRRYSRNCLGVKPVCFLKKRIKYSSSEKPSV